MGWFSKTSKAEVETPIARDSRIEVVAHKNSNKEVVAQAKEANQKLNELLVSNGFTVKIFLAAGGKTNKMKKVGA